MLKQGSNLTGKQEKFCNEFLVDLNATQAAIRAGYSKKTSYAIGGENLKKPEILKFLNEQQTKLRRKTSISQEEILYKLKAIIDFNITDVVQIKNGKVIVQDTNELSKEVLDSIVLIKETSHGIEVRFASKQKALIDLGKHLGMFKDKLDVNVSGEIARTMKVFVIPGFQGSMKEKADVKKIIHEALIKEAHEKNNE